MPDQPDLSHIAEPLRPLAIPIGEVTPDPANPNRHPNRNLEAIEQSLKTFGQRQPLVLRKADGVIEAGHGRYAAALNLGWQHIAAIALDDDKITAARYQIADNRSSELSVWDDDALVSLLKTINDEHGDLYATGYDDEDLQLMLDYFEQGQPLSLKDLEEMEMTEDDVAQGRIVVLCDLEAREDVIAAITNAVTQWDVEIT